MKILSNREYKELLDCKTIADNEATLKNYDRHIILKQKQLHELRNTVEKENIERESKKELEKYSIFVEVLRNVLK